MITKKKNTLQIYINTFIHIDQLIPLPQFLHNQLNIVNNNNIPDIDDMQPAMKFILSKIFIYRYFAVWYVVEHEDIVKGEVPQIPE